MTNGTTNEGARRIMWMDYFIAIWFALAIAGTAGVVAWDYARDKRRARKVR